MEPLPCRLLLFVVEVDFAAVIVRRIDLDPFALSLPKGLSKRPFVIRQAHHEQYVACKFSRLVAGQPPMSVYSRSLLPANLWTACYGIDAIKLGPSLLEISPPASARRGECVPEPEY